jgi:hypothetical protein
MLNFFFEKRAAYETMWKNTVQLDGPHMTKRRMRIACWIPKATNTHSEYVILTVRKNAPHCHVMQYVHCSSC